MTKILIDRSVVERTLNCLTTPCQDDLRLVLRDLFAALNAKPIDQDNLVQRLRSRRILTGDYGSALDQAAARIEALTQELETERLRLAGCGVAALGYFDGCKDEYRSASLEDTLRLYAKYEAQAKALDVALEALQVGVITLNHYNLATQCVPLHEAINKIKEVRHE